MFKGERAARMGGPLQTVKKVVIASQCSQSQGAIATGNRFM